LVENVITSIRIELVDRVPLADYKAQVSIKSRGKAKAKKQD